MRIPKGEKNDRKKGRSRRRANPIWRRRILPIGLPVLLAISMCGSGWWLWHSGTVQGWGQAIQDSAITASAEVGFRVNEVLVVGRERTKREDLLRAVGVRRGTAIFAFDPDAARMRIEALTWVREASVERRLPDTVLLRLVERRPMALWQRDDGFSLVDNQGEVIRDEDFGGFGGLLLVVGADAPRHIPELFRVLESQPDLEKRVSAAVRVGGRRWNVHLDNGVSVQLPEEGSSSAWAKLAEIEKSQHILSRDVQVLDLRFPDRLIVSTTPGKEVLPRSRGQET